MSTTVIVTKQYLKERIEANPSLVIGRALVALFRRQVEEEQSINATKHLNGRGFSKQHGRIGALGAKYFLKHGTLEPWQMTPWLKLSSNGFPSICRYAKQLNEIANEKINRATR